MLRLLFVFLVPGVAFGIGYDFSECRAALEAVESKSWPGEMGDTPQERQRYRERRGRLLWVRDQEAQHIYAATLLSRFEEDYLKAVNQTLRRLGDPERKAKFIAKLAREDAVLKRTHTQDLPAQNLLQALRNPSTTEDQLMGFVRDFAYRQAKYDVGGNEGEEAGFRVHLDDMLLDLGDSTTHAREARELVALDAEVLLTSLLRLKFHESLVPAAPLDLSFAELTANGFAQKIFEQEVSQLGFEVADPAVSSLSKKQRERFQKELQTMADRRYLEGLPRQTLLASADRAVARKNLPPYFQAELEKHVKFLREFNLPIDMMSRRYLEKIVSISERLPKPPSP